MLDVILSGSYGSTTGMGLGVLAARRLMDRCDIDTAPGQGTRITIGKTLPAGSAPMTPALIAHILSELEVVPDNMALSESRQQNRDLSDALAALQVRQEELIQLTTRLEETNARVEALNVLLDEKAQALQGADRRKDEFVAILSHELRGPLSAAGMAAQLLAASPVTAERTAKMSDVITRQVDHMSRLVEDLLDVSRVSRGVVAIERAPVDLRDVITEALEQVAAQARAKQHDMAANLPATACVIEGDKSRLVQVVSNLLGNAIRYTPAGGAISVALTAGADVVSLRVVDNGVGLAPELMPQLFDLYVQAERATVREGGGLGLGLALVKSLVEAHHGTVTARSDGVGMGSTFSVMFTTPGGMLPAPAQDYERRSTDLPT
jgi:signal transduction histidine kinase